MKLSKNDKQEVFEAIDLAMEQLALCKVNIKSGDLRSACANVDSADDATGLVLEKLVECGGD